MPSSTRPKPRSIHLRPTIAADLAFLFECQLDPAGNQLAGTKPRERAAFDAVWEQILRDPAAKRVAPRSIIADDTLVGSINIFPHAAHDGAAAIGYWIARDHWNRGIASRAVALMLGECAIRPLIAQVTAHNTASLRALERNGFAITSREHAPATERYTANEIVLLALT